MRSSGVWTCERKRLSAGCDGPGRKSAAAFSREVFLVSGADDGSRGVGDDDAGNSCSRSDILAQGAGAGLGGDGDDVAREGVANAARHIHRDIQGSSVWNIYATRLNGDGEQGQRRIVWVHAVGARALGDVAINTRRGGEGQGGRVNRLGWRQWGGWCRGCRGCRAALTASGSTATFDGAGFVINRSN